MGDVHLMDGVTMQEHSECVAAALEDLAQRARDGEIIGVAVGILYKDGSGSWRRSGATNVTLIGNMFAMTTSAADEYNHG